MTESPAHILVVVAEDDPVLRGALADALKDAGIDVLEARDGVQLLAILEGDLLRPPDVVISDVSMPSIGGLAVLSVVRSEGSRQPFIIMTGDDDPFTRDRVRGLDAAFVKKPLTLPSLIALVTQMAEAHRKSNESS